MYLNHVTNKVNGTSTLSAEEWNKLASDVNELGTRDTGEGGGTTPTVIDTSGVLSISSKNNIVLGNNNRKNINIEPGCPGLDKDGNSAYGDIALKPGDDIQFTSSHRQPKKRDKIVVKNIDGDDNPVKMQMVAGEIELAVGTENNPKSNTKKKNETTGADISNLTLFKAEDAKTLDVKILTGTILDKNGNDERDERAYLKVRAQAIDLRCEKHGGIALLPKGYDQSGNMNKIKFEHGGGDGLEFGTFNTEKTSIFTDEYRFNKNGVWKMATRELEASNKTIRDEREGGLQGLPATGAMKYKKQSDDFYDIIDSNDEQCTTEAIIRTANALNGEIGIHTKVTSKGNLEIETSEKFIVVEATNDPTITVLANSRVEFVGLIGTVWEIDDLLNIYCSVDPLTNASIIDTQLKTQLENAKHGDIIYINSGLGSGVLSTDNSVYLQKVARNINIESCGGLKLKGIIDFGSTFNFGETDNGIEVQNKYTAKGKDKDCGKLKVIAINNNASDHTFNTIWDPTANNGDGGSITETTVSVPAGESMQIALASIYDIIKLVNYMKDNNQGPWAPNNNSQLSPSLEQSNLETIEEGGEHSGTAEESGGHGG